QSRAHTPTQIALMEVLHGEIRMIVGDAELIETHDVRVAHALRNLVFLDEARQGQVDAGLIATRGGDLQGYEGSDLLALGDVELRDGTARQQPRTPVAGDAGITEAARLLRLGRDAPISQRAPVLTACPLQQLDEARVFDTVSIDDPAGTHFGGIQALCL